MHKINSWSNKMVFSNTKLAIMNIPRRNFWGQTPPPDFDPQKDYYKILGVSKTATKAEIKKKYARIIFKELYLWEHICF